MKFLLIMKQILKTHDSFTTSLPRLYYLMLMQKEFWNHAVEGEQLYNAFLIERLQGDKSIWDDPMTKRRFLTFTSKKKVVKVKLKDKLVTLREERTLMTRFIIGSTKRQGMDLQNNLGSCQFSVVPRSMFSSDFQLLLGSDKATTMHQVEALVQSLIENYQQVEGIEEVNIGYIKLFDGMAVVYHLKLGLPIINCQQFPRSVF